MIRRLPLVPALALVLLGVGVQGARALEGMTSSGAIRAKYLSNSAEDASALDARLDFDLVAGHLTVGGTYRAYQLTDPTYNPAGKDVPGSEIKHRYAEYHGEDFTARGGHFYSTFGLGLALRSYEEVDLEHDTVLDGLSAEYERGGVTLAALAGTAEERMYGTRYREHVLRGLRTGVSIGEWAAVAGSAIERASTDRDEEIPIPGDIARFEDRVLGGEAKTWIGPLTVVGEYAERKGENPVTHGDELAGHATYFSTTVDVGPLTLLGEFKDYERFQHHLVSPPTCVREHLWTLMNRATYEIDLNDERGFLVEGSAPIGESFHVEGGASETRNHDSDLLHWEIFGQADRSFGDRANVIVAGNWSREYELAKFTERMTGAADLETTLASGEVVSISVEGQLVEEPSGTRHRDYVAAFTFYPADDMTFSAVFETTNDPAEDADVWATVEVLKVLPEDVEVSVAMGTERGGKKCSGGVCYYEPEFEGVRLKLSHLF